MLTQIILVTILKIVRKLQITKIMTDFDRKYEVKLESAIFERLDTKFATTIIIRIERNVAANKTGKHNQQKFLCTDSRRTEEQYLFLNKDSKHTLRFSRSI